MNHSATAYRTGTESNGRIVVTTGNDVAGHRISEYLGVVRGIVVRSPNIGQSLVGAFKQLAGGNISQYVDVCEAARHEAYVRWCSTRRHWVRTPSSRCATTPPSFSRARQKYSRTELRYGSRGRNRLRRGYWAPARATFVAVEPPASNRPCRPA